MPWIVEQKEGGVPSRDEMDEQSWNTAATESDYVEAARMVLSGDAEVMDGSSLYAQLRNSADAYVFDLDGREAAQRQPGELVLYEQATLAVFFLFGGDEDRQACWRMLKERMRVPATVWWWPSRDEEDGGEYPGCTLVLLLRPGRLLLGQYSPAGLDAELRRFLGCPASDGDTMHATLRWALRISYEVVHEYMRVDWLRERDEVLRFCDRWEYEPA